MVLAACSGAVASTVDPQVPGSSPGRGRGGAQPARCVEDDRRARMSSGGYRDGDVRGSDWPRVARRQRAKVANRQM